MQALLEQVGGVDRDADEPRPAGDRQIDGLLPGTLEEARLQHAEPDAGLFEMRGQREDAQILPEVAAEKMTERRFIRANQDDVGTAFATGRVLRVIEEHHARVSDGTES